MQQSIISPWLRSLSEHAFAYIDTAAIATQKSNLAQAAFVGGAPAALLATSHAPTVRSISDQARRTYETHLQMIERAPPVYNPPARGAQMSALEYCVEQERTLLGYNRR